MSLNRYVSEHTGRLGPLGATVVDFQIKMFRSANVETVVEAIATLEDAVRKVDAKHRLMSKEVWSIELEPTKPAFVEAPVIKFVETDLEETSKTAATREDIESRFEFEVEHNGGEHLESTIYLKAGYPRTSALVYWVLTQDALFFHICPARPTLS